MIEDAKPGGVFRLTPAGMAISAPAAQPAVASSGSTHASAAKAPAVTYIPSFANNNCLSCHRIGPDGGDLAPSLNGIGSRRTADQIQAAIVSPPPTTSAGAKTRCPPMKKQSRAKI